MGTDLNAVAMFVKVVEFKSFRAAARALGAPTSTVSLKISQLEHHLGARLLERTTRSMRLTDVGSAYYRQVAPALVVVRDGERAVAGLQAEPTGRLRITAPVEFGGLVLADVLVDYIRRHPHVHVEVDLTDRHVDLVEEGFDVALRGGLLGDSSLVSRRLGAPQRLLLHASADYLRRRGEPRRPRDLADHDCLVMGGHAEPTTWRFRDARRVVAIEVRPIVLVNSFRVLHALAVAGLGIARFPEARSRIATRSSAMRTVLDEFCLPPTYWHAVYPSARNLSPAVRALLDLLEARFAAPPGRPQRKVSRVTSV